MKTKTKIAFIIDKLNIGGTEKQLLEIIERTDKENIGIFLVCLRWSEYFEKCDLPCEKYILNLKSIISIRGLIKTLLLAFYFRANNIDIVQTFFFDSTVIGVIAAKLACVKRVISCRRDMGFWYTPKILFVLRFVNKITDRILVNSDAIKKNVVSIEGVRGDKIDIIYNGIDLEKFECRYDTGSVKNKHGIPFNDRIIGVVANLNRPVKRVDAFIQAASEVLAKEEEVSFVIVGDGHLKEKLKYQAHCLGISKKVFFVGLQDNVIPYLQIFDIGVLPSESEGFPNSIIEYMAAGLPIICFDRGGSKELIATGKNGFVISDLKELSGTIIDLLKFKEKLQGIEKNNLLDVKRFEWGNILKKFENYYLSK